VYPALSVHQALTSANGQYGSDNGPEARIGNMAQIPRPPTQETAVPSFASSHPFNVLWVGGEGGMERDLVMRAKIPFEAIPAAGVHGVGGRALPGNLARLARGYSAARRILRRFRPDALLFTGGYVAVPMALAGRIPGLGFPRPYNLLYIPDIEPGLALKTLVRFADAVAVTAEETKTYLPSHIPVRITGYPIRPELRVWQVDRARAELGLGSGRPVLLVLGGSRGARSINRALLGALPELLPDMQIVHITGQLDYPDVKKAWEGLASQIQEAVRDGYHLYPYLHDEMGAAMSAADLVVSRAGASCLGEYPHFGLPAVLAPYPHAWRYQHINAAYLTKRGASVIIEDAELSIKLSPIVRELMRDQERRQKMRRAIQDLSRPGAAREIAGMLSHGVREQGI
jgi:UDP-N-acetylglucosamine--N-acetylmuramyl-(pentapeptide) pyrophosphoryl-undecaprenol N-acetylglucosamine transferase